MKINMLSTTESVNTAILYLRKHNFKYKLVETWRKEMYEVLSAIKKTRKSNENKR